LRSGRLIALVLVLAWFYLLLAVLVNPIFTPPNVEANIIMPFLSAETISLLWPVVLLLTPFVIVAGRRVTRPSGAAGRQVSAQEFARIQARAHATSESIRRGVRRQESRSVRSAAGEAAPPKAAETIEPSLPGLDAQKRNETKASEVATQSEFTPPPTTLREAVFGKATGTPPAGETTAIAPPTEETGTELADEIGDEDQRIEELEAGRGAVSSLMTRLEEMNAAGTIEPELYNKLKKKYNAEIDKINGRIGKLGTKERKKDSK
jgi:hypothetical protein